MIPLTTPPPCPAVVICEVAAETARSGWPHRPTVAEKFAVTHAVMARTLRGTGTITCAFKARTIATGTCRIVERRRGRVVRRASVRWFVWEDGTWGMVA